MYLREQIIMSTDLSAAFDLRKFRYRNSRTDSGYDAVTKPTGLCVGKKPEGVCRKLEAIFDGGSIKYCWIG